MAAQHAIAFPGDLNADGVNQSNITNRENQLIEFLLVEGFAARPRGIVNKLNVDFRIADFIIFRVNRPGYLFRHLILRLQLMQPASGQSALDCAPPGSAAIRPQPSRERYVRTSAQSAIANVRSCASASYRIQFLQSFSAFHTAKYSLWTKYSLSAVRFTLPF